MSNFTTFTTQEEKLLVRERIKEALVEAGIRADVFTPTDLNDKLMVIGLDVPCCLGSLAEAAARVESAFSTDVEIHSVIALEHETYAVTLRIVDVAALLAVEELAA